MSYQILNLEPEGYSKEAKAILERIGRVDSGPLGREELLGRVGQYDALVTRLGHVIDREVLERGERLRVVATATTGLTHVDVKTAEERGIAVLSLKGEVEFLQGIHATPEYTWALLLSLIRKIPGAVLHVREGGWNRNLFKGTELYGKTLGIIGFGRVGSKIAGYAHAFGINVLAYDQKELKAPGYVRFVALDTLLAESDIISVHVPYDGSTHHMIDERAIAAMKQGVVLVNTSRGGVLDEHALLEALRSGHVKGAALDVLEAEHSEGENWAVGHPLIAYAKDNENLLITSHIAGATFESMEKTEIFIAEKLQSFFL
jgi:D-3-phosphoglycerate dehydrogenase / 2-oxoglutarate reductase